MTLLFNPQTQTEEQAKLPAAPLVRSQAEVKKSIDDFRAKVGQGDHKRLRFTTSGG